MRLGKLAVLLAVAGGITVLIAGWSAVGDPAPCPLLAAFGGLVALVTGVLAARHVFATVRYRITKPNAGLWLAAQVVGALGVFAVIAVVARCWPTFRRTPSSRRTSSTPRPAASR